MNLKQTTTIAILIAVMLLLSACVGQLTTFAPTAAPVQPTVAQATKSPATAAPSQPAATQSARPTPTQPRSAIPPGDLTRTNEGGSVTFAIKPINLGSGASTLDFEVDMNTHSVDLGVDLKALSVLKTDAGVEVAPLAYQGGSGHHVSARLSFPADKLAGAKKLTLVIRNLAGIPERIFSWNL